MVKNFICDKSVISQREQQSSSSFWGDKFKHETKNQIRFNQSIKAYIPVVVLEAALIGHSRIYLVLPEEVLQLEVFRVNTLIEV